MRRKIAWALTLAMIITSVPVNSFTVHAEDIIVEEYNAEEALTVSDEGSAAGEAAEVSMMEEVSVVEVNPSEELAEYEMLMPETEVTEMEVTETEALQTEYFDMYSEELSVAEGLVVESVEEVEDFADLEEVDFGEVAEEEMYSVGDPATEEDFEGAVGIDLAATSVIDVEIDSAGDVDWFKFSPEVSGKYIFTSYMEKTSNPNEYDTYGVLYTEDCEWLVDNDQDGGDGQFKIEVYLKAGKTYYLAAHMYYGEYAGSYKIKVEKTDLYIDGEIENEVLVPYNAGKTLSISAESTNPISYQWYKNDGTEVIGTESSFEIGAVTQYDKYSCKVTVGEYSETVIFEVYVDTQLEIDEEKSITHKYVSYNGSAEFYVAASAREGVKLTYTWYKGDGITEDILEANTERLILNGQTESTCYTCKVEDEFGRYELINCYVEIDSLIIHTTEDECNVFADANQKITLNVKAESNYDSESIEYQWYNSDGTRLENETDTYQLTVTQSMDLYCHVSDGCDQETVYFYIMVNPGYTVDWGKLQDYWTNVEVGTDIILEVPITVKDGYRITYQWYDENGTLLEDCTGNTMSLENIQKSGYYTCVISDEYDNRDEVSFSVEVNTLYVENNAYNYYMVNPGQKMILQVDASSSKGEGALRYRWTKYDYSTGNTENLEETGDSLVIDRVTGDIRYECQVDDGENSEYVYFNLSHKSSLAYEYSSYVIVDYGKSEVLSVDASSDYGPVTYQWYKRIPEGEYVEIDGANGASYRVEHVTENQRYMCEISDAYESKTADFWVTVAKDMYLEYTAENYVLPGQSTELKVTVLTDQAKVTYEWQKYDENTGAWTVLEGENASSCIIESVNQDAKYRCIVSNGNITETAVFSVIVNCGLELEYTGNVEVMPGEPAELSVSADTKFGSLEYTWYYYNLNTNTWDELNEKGASLNISEITENAEYRCTVFDGYSSMDADFHIKVVSGLKIAAYESEVELRPGKDAVLTVDASNSLGTELNYTWEYYYDAYGDEYNPIEGADSATYIVNTSNVKDSEVLYRCTVSDEYETCYAFFCVKTESDLDISYEPDVTVNPNETAELKVIAVSDAENITFQWQYFDSRKEEWEHVNSPQTDTFITKPITEELRYRCLVNDDYSREWAYFNVIPVMPDSDFTVNYKDTIEVLPGKNAVLSVTAHSEKETLFYQWYMYNPNTGRDHMLIGETSRELNIANLKMNAEYSCRITDGCRTKEARINVICTTGLKCSRLSEEYQEAVPGSAVKMAVSASTKDPAGVSYQWYAMEYTNVGQKERLLAGETKAELTVTVNGNQQYYCLVSDSFWAEEVYFCVEADTGLSLNGSDTNEIKAAPGSDVPLVVNAKTETGNTLTYEWFRYDENDGYIRLDETSNQYTIKDLQASEKYICDISDGYDFITVSFYVFGTTGFTVNTEDALIVIKNDEPAELFVDASTSEAYGPLTYNWYEWKYDYNDEVYKWVKLSTESDTLTVSNIRSYKKYYCEVSDKINSDKVEFTVLTEEASEYSAFDFVNAKDMMEGVSTVKIIVPGNQMYLKFVPEKTGNYVFESIATESDTYAKLYDAEQEQLMDDDDNGEDNNFKITYDLYAGKTYYFAAQYYDKSETGSFKVRLKYNGALQKHHWDDGTIITAPDCIHTGVITYVCTDQECTAAYTETLPSKGGHKSVYTAAAAATCTVNGNIEHWTCSECGKCFADPVGKTEVTKESTVIAATGAHTWTTVTDKAATCGAAGSQHLECTACKTKQAATSIPATGKHVYANDYKVTKEATCLAAGSKTRSCTVCNGAPQTEEIKKLAGTVTPAASKLTLGLKKSVKASKLVSGLMDGDYITNVTTSKSGFVAVKKSGNDWTITGKKVTSKKKDNADITITLASGASAKITFSVQKNAVATSSLKVTNANKKLTLTVGEKLTLETVVKPVTTSDKLTFTTSDKKVVTVSKSGQIVAKKAGKATVTVKSGKKSYKITVTVKKTAPTDFTLSKTTLNLKVKKSATLKAKFKPNGSEGKVTFKSSAPKIASVNKTTGKVTAKKKGTATITATMKSATGEVLTKTCKVVVKK